MTASFDSHGPTVVGNKVMISGTTTNNVGTITVDVSPYMRVIEQVILNDASGPLPIQLRNQADDGNLLVNGQYFVQQLTDTTFKFILSSIPDLGVAADATPEGVFVVIGRK